MLDHDDDAIDEFGTRLRQVRHWRGLSQADVARATGMAACQVSNFEAGRYGPSMPNLVRLVRALGSPAYLFGLADVPEPAKGGAA